MNPIAAPARAADPEPSGAPTRVRLRPRYEGTNIGTWIGFKHVNYLVEEAVLDHLRATGRPPGTLFAEYGLCVDIVDIDTRILHALRIDDLALAEVRPVPARVDGPLAFTVTMHVGDSPAVRAVTAKVKVSLRHDPRGGPVEAVPPSLLPHTVARLGAPATGTPDLGTPDLGTPATGNATANPAAGSGDPLVALTTGRNAFAWKWRIPYFYCHFNDRMQMSGYLRVMEEVVDLFLAERGLSIRTMLSEHSWIPAVPHSRITLLDEALMEEELYTVLTVQDVFKQFTYTAAMDCYVVRDGVLVPTATGRITHGYAEVRSRSDWGLVNFGDRVAEALSGGPARSAHGSAHGRGDHRQERGA